MKTTERMNITDIKDLNLLIENLKKIKIGKRPKYTEKVIPFDDHISARSRMLDVKNNLRGKYVDSICRGSGNVDEQVLRELTGLHNNDIYEYQTYSKT